MLRPLSFGIQKVAKQQFSYMAVRSMQTWDLTFLGTSAGESRARKVVLHQQILTLSHFIGLNRETLH
jgi:hypothetical protein